MITAGHGKYFAFDSHHHTLIIKGHVPILLCAHTSSQTLLWFWFQEVVNIGRLVSSSGYIRIIMVSFSNSVGLYFQVASITLFLPRLAH